MIIELKRKSKKYKEKNFKRYNRVDVHLSQNKDNYLYNINYPLFLLSYLNANNVLCHFKRKG